MTLVLAVLALALFALFDYAGYNTIGQRALKTYRILQTIFGAWLIYILWCVLGNLAAAIMAGWLWWTWNADILYYEYCRWFNWFKTESTDSFQKEVMGDLVTWAWWTPYGLLRTALGKGGKDKPINGAVLVVQASVGIMGAVAYQLFLLW